jgi:CRISPR/Cas system-associated exonuclease Cas4 (RecB family)
MSDCEYNAYSLQLSLYAYMYQSMTGKRVGKLGIAYLDSENKFNVYYSPYLLTDVQKIINHVKN